MLRVLFTSNLFHEKQKKFKFHCHINPSSSHNPGVLDNRKVTKTFFSPVDLNLFYNLLPGEIVFDSKFLTVLAFIIFTVIEKRVGGPCSSTMMSGCLQLQLARSSRIRSSLSWPCHIHPVEFIELMEQLWKQARQESVVVALCLLPTEN